MRGHGIDIASFIDLGTTFVKADVDPISFDSICYDNWENDGIAGEAIGQASLIARLETMTIRQQRRRYSVDFHQAFQQWESLFPS